MFASATGPEKILIWHNINMTTVTYSHLQPASFAGNRCRADQKPAEKGTKTSGTPAHSEARERHTSSYFGYKNRPRHLRFWGPWCWDTSNQKSMPLDQQLERTRWPVSQVANLESSWPQGQIGPNRVCTFSVHVALRLPHVSHLTIPASSSSPRTTRTS